MNKALTILLIIFSVNTFGQLANGSIAPDFTLTDYYGNEHNLYEYLDDGKTVFVEIFAAHCSACWNYHTTNRLKNIYNLYGPDGTDEIMVLALEHDQWNHHDSFKGIGDPWNTAGNWLEGTPYPIFDVEDPDRGVFDDYNVIGYPVIYKVCPDRITERVFLTWNEETLYEKVQGCLESLSTEEMEKLDQIYFDNTTGNLVIEDFENVRSIRVMTLNGQVLQTFQEVNSSQILINKQNTGIYLFEIQTDKGVRVERFFVR